MESKKEPKQDLKEPGKSTKKEQLKPDVMTTSWGAPIVNNQHSITAGTMGPVLLQDVALIDKIASFDHERIPERVVHAKGAGGKYKTVRAFADP